MLLIATSASALPVLPDVSDLAGVWEVPVGVTAPFVAAVDEEGRTYVADTQCGLRTFSDTGTPLATGSWGGHPRECTGLWDARPGPDGSLYIIRRSEYGSIVYERSTDDLSLVRWFSTRIVVSQFIVERDGDLLILGSHPIGGNYVGVWHPDGSVDPYYPLGFLPTHGGTQLRDGSFILFDKMNVVRLAPDYATILWRYTLPAPLIRAAADVDHGIAVATSTYPGFWQGPQNVLSLLSLDGELTWSGPVEPLATATTRAPGVHSLSTARGIGFGADGTVAVLLEATVLPEGVLTRPDEVPRGYETLPHIVGVNGTGERQFELVFPPPPEERTKMSLNDAYSAHSILFNDDGRFVMRTHHTATSTDFFVGGRLDYESPVLNLESVSFG